MNKHITRSLRWLLPLAVALAIPAAASAAPAAEQFGIPLTASQASAVGQVERWENSQAQPNSNAELLSERSAVQPSIDAIVNDAKATGNGNAIKVLAHIPVSTPGSSAVHGALMKYMSGYESGPTPPSPAYFATSARVRRHHRVVAHTAGCWGAGGSVWTAWYFAIPGGAGVGHISIIASGWCGNGSSMYGSPQGQFFFRSDSSTGFCFMSPGNQDPGSWLQFYGWWHGGYWRTMGTDTFAFGCTSIFGTDSGHATLRVAANGYWDRLY